MVHLGGPRVITYSYYSLPLACEGARCSSVVRAFAHRAMGRRIDPSWGGPIELFLIPACAPRPSYVLSCLWDGAYKRTLAVNWKELPMWRQRVSFLTIRMVLNHMSDTIYP